MSQGAEARASGLQAVNYCLGFIDLLGQRIASVGQQLLPQLTSEAERNAFNDVLKNSIGRIRRLQKNAQLMFEEVKEADQNSPFRQSLPAEKQAIWDDALRSNTQTQRWSDGLVFFASLGDLQIKCPAMGMYEVFTMSGSHCLLGLAGGQPIRGGIDVAWGVELHPAEIYGPAVVRAYELESEKASYPRIVIGQSALDVLEAYRNAPQTDAFLQLNAHIAELCLRMTTRDEDGMAILHYLGDDFHRAVTKDAHVELYSKAHRFATDQLKEHTDAGDCKLAPRYTQLLKYLDAYPASAEEA